MRLLPRVGIESLNQNTFNEEPSLAPWVLVRELTTIRTSIEIILGIFLCTLRDLSQEENPKMLCQGDCFIGLAYQGKDIVFRFIVEYSSLIDFGP